MPATPITDAVPGESLVGTEPQLLQQVDPGWRRRLNLFTGRALTESALDNEQTYRAGLLATLGQSVTAGTVTGLALTMNMSGADPVLTVSPGYGIAAYGQDVALNATLKTTLSTLAVIDSISGAQVLTFREYVLDPNNKTYAGILILQPVIAQVSGQALDSGAAIVVSGNLGASCYQDPAERVFEDTQIVDAARLVFLPWPTGASNLPLPPAAPQTTWRNRLAYAIFEAEALLGADDQLPWAMLGVPVALIAFDPGTVWAANTAFTAGQFLTDTNGNIQTVQTAGTSGGEAPGKWSTVYGGATTDGSVTWVNNGLGWKPLFVDCSAVVRAGGLPRQWNVLPAQAPASEIWQAGTRYIAGSFIVDSNGFIEVAVVAGTSGGPPPAWATTPGQTTTDGSVTWINNGPWNWKPNTAFSAGHFFVDSNKNLQYVNTAGITGAAAPTWNATAGQTTADGTAIWKNYGPGTWTANKAALAGQFFVDPNGNVQYVQTAGVSGATGPVWTATAGQQTQDGTVTWMNFGAGSWQAHTAFAARPFVVDTEGNQQFVQIPGTSGATEPKWNEIYLQTSDGTVTWVNEGTGNPPIVQAGLAQARIRQLSEQLSQAMSQRLSFATLADLCATLPPSGIVPAGAMDFVSKNATWFPANWTVSAAPVFLEELETVLLTGMTMAPLEASATAPGDTDLMEPVEVLVPLPDSLYDPDILVTETVAPVFQQEVDQATAARNLTLRDMQTVEEELNTLFAAIGPNAPVNVNLIDPDAGLTADELEARNAMPPYTPGANETFGTLPQTTWLPANAYGAGQFVIDGNGELQIVQTAGTSATASPIWNTSVGETTPDGVSWINSGNAVWQANFSYNAGQFILDATGNVELAVTTGTSGAAAPAWNATTDAQTTDNTVTWNNMGKTAWAANTQFATGQAIVDANGFIELAQAGGLSGSTQPAWPTSFHSTIVDGSLTWLNNGPWNWQPDTAYVAGQFVVDAGGFMQVVTTAGASASTAPSWSENVGQTTPDGIAWLASGSASWESDTPYTAGQLLFDTQGNIQQVQAAGISGDSAPSWSSTLGQTTQDSSVTWTCLGHSAWAANTSYSAGQAIVDSNGEIQLVLTPGTSGATQPQWEKDNAITQETSVLWTNTALLRWQASKAYTAGQVLLDANGNIEFVKTTGTSGGTAPAWNTTPAGTTSDGTVTWMLLSFYSTQIAQLQQVVGQEPYTKTFQDSQGNNHAIALIGADDITNLQTNGLSQLIISLNARIAQANDLLDTAFLTAQTDIYRYRQNVLGTAAASTLATSTILANIAGTGNTATATAANLQDYMNTLQPPPTTSTTSSTTSAGSTTTTTATTPPVFIKPVILQTKIPIVLANRTFTGITNATSTFTAQAVRSRAVAAGLGAATSTTAPAKLTGAINIIKPVVSPVLPVSPILPIAPIRPVTPITPVSPITTAGTTSIIGRLPISTVSNLQSVSSGVVSSSFTLSPVATATSSLAGVLGRQTTITSPAQILVPGQNVPATPTDITNQSPVAGAQLNIRTLTIAQRLAESPSGTAMFYSIGNRLSFLQVLQMFATELNFAVDDLPLLVDGQALPPAAGTTAPPPQAVPVETHTFSEWLDAGSQAALQAKIQAPYLAADSDEATAFSVGVRVVEQHTMMLRAIEARVQQYQDFVNLCNTALGTLQSNIQQAQAYISQLSNNLMQDRQNVAFTTSLLADETARVQNVNAQRLQVLQSSVQLVAYTRARTLTASDTTPSRQLVPANIANPVPACLRQSVSIPPELREIVSQLREAPVSWLPAVAAQLNNLQRPILLQELALSVQSRATQQLQLATLPSSAAGESGPYASTIATVYSANAQVFRGLQVQRANFQPAALTSLSWSLQAAAMQSVTAVNDLISASAVHTEISNATARLIQQISSVATCIYTRAGLALPVDRLAWAEFLSGAGSSASLQSLAVLPSWNDLSYTDRQQMQLLADWLFQQIDTTNAAATAFMSDVVRTAILLASDVPIDNIIPGNVLIRTQPVVGGVVSLSLPSDRIASGMYVNLYSGANLAARGVVSDLDSSSASATVTDVFQQGVFLNASDTVHFTTLAPRAIALRPLFTQG